jgi:hypothetical protein
MLPILKGPKHPQTRVHQSKFIPNYWGPPSIATARFRVFVQANLYKRWVATSPRGGETSYFTLMYHRCHSVSIKKPKDDADVILTLICNTLTRFKKMGYKFRIINSYGYWLRT